NERNPNKMKQRDFDLLCDNFNQTGWTDPILARPFDFKKMKSLAKLPEDELLKAMEKEGCLLEIVGGHHRFDAAQYVGFEAGPVTVIMDPQFDEEKANFQLVRMNAIRGKLDPQAFFDLYNGLSKKYTDDVLQDAFGFA